MENGEWGCVSRALHDSAPPPGELSPKATEGAARTCKRSRYRKINEPATARLHHLSVRPEKASMTRTGHAQRSNHSSGEAGEGAASTTR